MNEPVGWRWIEAWRNGTIDDQDFLALQQLLRENPEARRTLRRAMALDTALRDRAEARLLVAESESLSESLSESVSESVSVAKFESADAPIPTPAVTAPRARFARREVVAWAAAAACAFAAVSAWLIKPTTTPSPPLIVDAQASLAPPGVEEREPAAAVLTIAEQREQLLASAPDVLHLQLASDDGDGARIPGGDIVWSSGRQIGYLRLPGAPRDTPKPCQYQLWIVGSDTSGNEIIKAGAFAVEGSAGELILPILADQFVQQPKMFVVSVEHSEGETDWTAPLLAKADGARP